MRIAIASAALLAVSACGAETEERLNTGAGTYAIPSEHISTVTREPHTFVRIKNADKPFDLVFDSRAQGTEVAPGIPRIFSVNDKGQTGIEYYRSRFGVVVCRKAVHPNSGCGVRVEHDGSEWTILFPIKRVREAEPIVREALALLDHYSV